MSWLRSIKTRRGRLDLNEAATVWRRFRRYTRRHVGTLALAILASLGATVMVLLMPWPIKIVFDYVLSDTMRGTWLADLLDRVAGTPMNALTWACGAIIVMAVLDGLFNYWRDVLLAQTGQRIVGRLRQDVFKHLQTLPPSEFERRRTGDLLTRLTGDILMMRQMLTDALVTFGQGVLMILGLTIAMFCLSVTLGLITLIAVPMTAWATVRISKQIRLATRQAREKESAVANIAHDVISAMPIIQAFNRETVEKERFARFNRSTIRAGVRTTKLESRLYRTVAISSALAMCAILFVGVRSVVAGEMTAGDLLVFIAYLRALSKPMRRISKVTGQIAKATTCGQRLVEILNIQPLVQDAPEAVELPPVEGAISFDRVNFAYPDGRRVLHEVQLQITAGERVAIVGHSGAGKSTLIKLLLRFYDPTSGRLLVDGVDLRCVTRQSLRRQIGWVHQDTVLFGLTVAENIALAKGDASPQEIAEVARRVQADRFIDSMPDGYDTLLGQSALTLSGGERQRLALARALLHKPRILLLDEPATGLDAVTRRIVSETWMAAENQATTIVICHRLYEMERFDRVIMFDQGRLIAAVPHHELLRQCPDYAQAYDADRMEADSAAVPEDRVSC